MNYVLDLQDIDKTKTMAVGGKAANLGELFKIEEVLVPDGFCVSTEAFKEVMGGTPSISELLDQLSLLKVEEQGEIARLSDRIRRAIEGTAIPDDIEQEITSFLSILGERDAYAVRSSATAEDLPTASFAGQHDTYLNTMGREEILKHVRKCWASLFTGRSVIYRLQNGFGHRKVYPAVIVQKMVFPQAAGVLFTADPISSNRKVSSIDASFGLGEALVSGLVNADLYKVQSGKIIDKKIATKKLAIYPLTDGGTIKQELSPEQQTRQVLTDGQILELEGLGRKIEEHFGCPQDIEWCLADEKLYVVQSRPITTLYPIPKANDEENRVYLSVGHQQMMTDAMKPLGMSIFQLTSFGPRFQAGGRLFVDITQMLVSPISRSNLLKMMGRHDPLIEVALITIIQRGDFIKVLPDEESEPGSSAGDESTSLTDSQAQTEADPTIVLDLIASSQTSIRELKRNIQAKSGSDLLDFILEDIQELKRILFDPKSTHVINSAMHASFWINENMEKWLGEKDIADTLSQSVPNNITSEMGLDLLDVADVIRPYPEIVDYLQNVHDENLLDGLASFEGGEEMKDAMLAFLDKYGMRCSGEIDLTRPRWNEKPTTLVPVILSNIKNFEPNARKRKFEQGLREALEKEQEIMDRLRQLPDGEQKAQETKRMISLIRNYSGFREYPKYGMVSRYFVYKRALLKEAEQLVKAGVIQEKEDIYYLTFEELHEVVRTNELDYQIIAERKNEFKSYEKLTPPRVITSDGEIITGKYKRENLPAGAIVGLPVSSGVIEGRARVILKLEDAELEYGDILVTSFTDPSWTPLFVSIKGLVTEVGGQMTHGAVIAREYGLPAVVGVENATKLIQDGQRIRVNGTEGYVEII